MEIIALLKAALAALAALPQILEKLDASIKAIKLEAVQKDYDAKIASLEAKINDYTKAKTNAEIASSIAALNKRS